MTRDTNATASDLVVIVADLLAQLDGTAVTECEFRSGDQRIMVRRSPTVIPRDVAPAITEQEAVPAHWRPISSPLAGIFYAAEKPQSPPLVSVGARVSVGQTIGLIEAMKTFNRVESDLSGVVRAILVANSTEVQAGQFLLYVEPLGEAP
jgi:acetyl-CoA carboxylase biotin carboxyl carrier protein